MSETPTAEDLLIRSIERSVGPLLPMGKEAEAPVSASSSGSEVLEFADRLEKEAQSLRDKEAGIRTTMLLGGAKEVLRKNPVTRAVRSAYQAVVPQTDEAVLKAQAASRREYARAGTDAARQARKAVKDLSPEEAKKMFFGGKKMSPTAEAMLYGLGAGTPVAVALAATREPSRDVVIQKGGEAPPVYSDLDVTRFVEDIEALGELGPEARTKVASAADEWAEVLVPLVETLTHEKRAHLTTEEVLELAESYAKVASAAGENITANALVSALEEPTLEGFDAAVEKVATVSRALGIGRGVLGKVRMGATRVFNPQRYQRIQKLQTRAITVREGQKATAGVRSKVDLMQAARAGTHPAGYGRGKAQRELSAAVKAQQGVMGQGRRAREALKTKSMAERAGHASLGSKLPQGAGFRLGKGSFGAGWQQGRSAASEAAEQATKAVAKPTGGGVNPYVLYGGVGAGAYMLGKSGEIDKEAIDPVTLGVLGLGTGYGAIKGMRALAPRVGGALKGMGGGWAAGAKARAARKAQVEAARAGGKFVQEGAEEAAKEGLTGGQKLLAGGIGTGALLMGSRQSRTRGPQVQVTRY
jgi:hypothetical protein